jgi:EAL domain-containing protein (putative c-di-GMP-specific phosphodiesterase class I)
MNLVKNLKMDVLCEGVETSETANFLRSIGCKVVQGYLFDRPINCNEFKKKYLSNKGVLKFDINTHSIDTNTIS